MITKQLPSYQSLLKKWVLGIFLIVFSGTHAAIKTTKCKKNNYLLQALLLTNIPLKKLKKPKSSTTTGTANQGLLDMIPYELLEAMLAPFHINQKLPTSQLLAKYAEAINKEAYDLYSYKQVYGINSLEKEEYTILNTDIKQHPHLVVGHDDLNSKKNVNAFIRSYVTDQKKATWVDCRVALQLIGINPKSKQIAYVEQYVQKRDQGDIDPQLLRKAGLNPSLDIILRNPKKVRWENGKVKVKISNITIEKGFSLNKHTTLIMPKESQLPSKKWITDISYQDRLTEQRIQLRLKGFIIYDPINREYETYRKEVTKKGVIYYTYKTTAQGWKCTIISAEEFRKAKKRTRLAIYSRTRVKPILVTAPKKEGGHHAHNLFTLASFIGNLYLAIAYLWITPPSKPDEQLPRRDEPIMHEPEEISLDKRKNPDDVRGIKNEGFSCFFNATIQGLSEYFTNRIKLSDQQNSQIDRNSHAFKAKPVDERIIYNISETLKNKIFYISEYVRDNVEPNSQTKLPRKITTASIYADINSIIFTKKIIEKIKGLRNWFADPKHFRTAEDQVLIKKFEATRLTILKKMEMIYGASLPNQENQQSMTEANRVVREEASKVLPKANLLLHNTNEAEFEGKNNVSQLTKAQIVQLAILSIKEFVNTTSKDIFRAWQGDRKSKANLSGQSFIQPIAMRYRLYEQQDAAELVEYMADLLGFPEDQSIIYASNRIYYDATGKYDIKIADNKILSLKEGMKGEEDQEREIRDNSFQVHLLQLSLYDEKMNGNLPKDEYLAYYLAKNMEEEYEDSYKKVTLRELIENMTISDPNARDFLLKKYDTIDKRMLAPFIKYDYLQKERTEKMKENRDKNEKNGTNEPISIEPSPEEIEARENLFESTFFETLVSMGFNPEVLKEEIEKDSVIIDPATNRNIAKNTGIKLYQDSYTKAYSIDFSLSMKTVNVRKIHTDYFIAAPTIFFSRMDMSPSGRIIQIPGKFLQYKIKPNEILSLPKDSTDPNSNKLIDFTCEGIVMHSGASVKSGHYTCYRKHKGGWYYMNDDYRPWYIGNTHEALEKAIQDQVAPSPLGSLSSWSPYLFVYKKKEAREERMQEIKKQETPLSDAQWWEFWKK